MAGLWPWDVTWTQRKLQSIEDNLDRLREELRAFRREERQKDLLEMTSQQEVLDGIRQMTSFSQSTNATLREAIALLRAGQSDPAKNAEALTLLQAAQADDLAILKENTPEGPTPSGV